MTVLLALLLWLVQVVLATQAMELRKIFTCCLSINRNEDGPVFRSTQLGSTQGGQKEAMQCL